MLYPAQWCAQCERLSGEQIPAHVALYVDEDALPDADLRTYALKAIYEHLPRGPFGETDFTAAESLFDRLGLDESERSHGRRWLAEFAAAASEGSEV